MREIQRNLDLVNQMWERSLTVSLIAEDLERCFKHDHADSILRRMEENNWNEIGFLLPSSQSTVRVKIGEG